MAADKPKFTYVSAELFGGSHAVFIVHDDKPEWYRLIATFVSKGRAESYTEIENDFRPGGSAGMTEDEQWQDDIGPAPDDLPAEPLSSTAQYVERAREKPQPEPAPVPVTVPAPAAAVVRASSLPAVTAKQARIFAGLLRLGAGWHTQGEIQREAGIIEATDSMTALRLKGFVSEGRSFTPRRYRAIAEGEPLIEIPKSQNSWTEAQDVALRTMCENGGDFEALALTIGRTPAACRTRATNRGWYRMWSERRYRRSEADLPAAEVVTIEQLAGSPAPPPPEPVTEPEPVVAQPETTTTLNDLSARAKNVLKGIALGRDAGDEDFGDYVGVEQRRVPFLTARLETLGCIKMVDRRWQVTALGECLAANIAKPTTISMPVIRRPEPEPAPVKANGHAFVPAGKPVTDQLPADSTRINAVDYLERKGRSVTRLGGGNFLVDGERRNLSDVVMMINAHRRAAELPPKGEVDIW